jgi:hypothetical protein
MSNLACEVDTFNLCRVVSAAFVDAGFVPRVHIPKPVPPAPRPVADRPLPVGSLVVLEADPTTAVTIRVVVGRRKGGSVVSTLVDPPPWQKPTFRTDPESHVRRLDGVGEHRFRPACTACPIRHGCERSESDAPIPMDTCFLQRHLRPSREAHQ